MTLDAAFGGTLMNSSQDVAYNLIEKMTKNHHSWVCVQQVIAKSTPKIGGLYEVNVFDHINTNMDALYQKIDSLSITPTTPITPTHVAYVSPATLYCEICGVNGHTDRDCKMILVGGSTQENVNFVNNNQQNNLYSNTYNPGVVTTLISIIGTTTPNKPWD